MYTFLELKKSAKRARKEDAKNKVVVMGNCATQHLCTAIKGYAYLDGMALDIIDTDYNQISAQIMDNTSELYFANPDFVIIQMASEKIYDDYYASCAKASFAENTINEIKKYWSIINSRIKTNIIHFNFASINDEVFGNYSSKVEESFPYQIRKLNYLLQEAVLHYKNVNILDIDSIQSQYGRNSFYDPKFYYMAKMPIGIDFLPFVAKNIMDVIKAAKGSFKKCVICDLDNTLWGGVIGDDGLNGIEIGELGSGHAFEDLQKYLKLLKERGIILGICSKNNEDVAKEPFEKHPDMVLRMDDISIFVANWNDKASNIRYIQKTLNIGMDSIVFLDDNPFERNLVREMIPDITVPELPDDATMYVPYLRELNLFETASYSSTDKDRTKQYKAEVDRVKLEQSFENYDDYLIGLEMIAEVRPFDDFQTPRIAQLTQRSNQFNLRTVRLSEADVLNIRNDDNYITAYFTLKDKFGDHGLISLAYLKKIDENTLFIENWLMSCRVLKRGMEEFVINKLVDLAKENGFSIIQGEYLKTPKNSMVENIYEKLGFSKIKENEFELEISNFKINKTFIKEQEN